MNIEQFIMKYQPLEKDGEIRQWDWTVSHEWNEILKAKNEHKLCTVIEDEDDMLIINGIHLVNRLYYIITKHVIEEEYLNIKL